MTALDDDRLLVLGIKRGEEKAHERFLEMYGVVLLRFVMFVLRANEQEAEDIAVETMYKAIERIDTFEFREHSPNGFRNWLFQIAKNIFRDKRRLELELQSLDEETLVVVSSEQIQESSEASQAVTDAMETLPENQRITLVLFFSGWQLTEIADHYGTKPGTVRQWKARGLKTMTEILGEHPAIQDLLQKSESRIGENK